MSTIAIDPLIFAEIRLQEVFSLCDARQQGRTTCSIEHFLISCNSRINTVFYDKAKGFLRPIRRDESKVRLDLGFFDKGVDKADKAGLCRR